MLWRLSNPINSAITHGDVWIEAFGDGFCDDGLLIGFQFLYHRFLQSHHFIHFTTYLIQKICNLLLRRKIRNRNPQLF